MITQSRLKELYRLEGNELIGIVRGSKNFGRVAGCSTSVKNATRVMIDGTSYLKGRLIALYQTGTLPEAKFSKCHQEKVDAESRRNTQYAEFRKLTTMSLI